MTKKSKTPSADENLIVTITVSRLDLLKQAVLEFGDQVSRGTEPRILDVEIKPTKAATVGKQQRATAKIYVDKASDLFWLGRDYYILLSDEKLRESNNTVNS